jgi:hypothetical protein
MNELELWKNSLQNKGIFFKYASWFFFKKNLGWKVDKWAQVGY